MKKINLILILSLLVITSQAQQNKTYLEYIEKYNQVAIREMNQYGIPASITLAQGLLESGAGRSELAKNSNNHFGIKCRKDWAGERVYHDDDAKGECFRKYKTVLDSYEDHSLFLAKGNRYASLFQLSRTDYKSWARGLKAAGYATDPAYANRLIKLIEDYNLHAYDLSETPSDNLAPKEDNKALAVVEENDKTAKKKVKSKNKKEKNAEINKVFSGKTYIAEITPYRIHPVQKINGVKSVVAVVGDTFESIASEFGLFEKELRKANELKYGSMPKDGDIVFLYKKKNKGKKGASYTVQEGETMYQISQKQGIKERKLYKINGLVFGSALNAGDVLKLR